VRGTIEVALDSRARDLLNTFIGDPEHCFSVNELLEQV
jgi:hypothetical protein